MKNSILIIHMTTAKTPEELYLFHQTPIELDKNFKNTAIKKALMAQAWDILMNITEHTGAWIVDTKKWSKTELIKHLE